MVKHQDSINPNKFHVGRRPIADFWKFQQCDVLTFLITYDAHIPSNKGNQWIRQLEVLGRHVVMFHLLTKILPSTTFPFIDNLL